MRVAIFGESYLPYLSGVTVSTDALARGLAGAGHEVLLVVPRPSGAPIAEPEGIDVAWLPAASGGAVRLSDAVAAAIGGGASRPRLPA